MTNAPRACLALTAAGIAGYWVSVLTDLFPVVDLVPGYRQWFLSFPLADGWIALAALLALATFRSNRNLSAIFTAATGSGLIFLGLYAFAYGVNAGLVFRLTLEEVIEIAIKLYCLLAGAWLVVSAYQLIRAVPENRAIPADGGIPGREGTSSP